MTLKKAPVVCGSPYEEIFIRVYVVGPSSIIIIAVVCDFYIPWREKGACC
jgi:hypothetical protein